MIFIDGDHRREGVRQDTELGLAILAEYGVITWHDANPREKYKDIKLYLEQDLSVLAVGTNNNYIGGIACWSHAIERHIKQKTSELQEII